LVLLQEHGRTEWRCKGSKPAAAEQERHHGSGGGTEYDHPDEAKSDDEGHDPIVRPACPVEIDFDNFDSAVCGARTDFEFKRLAAAAVWHAGCLFHGGTENSMLKISVVDSRTQCWLVLEGRLIAPWVEELRTAWKRAKAELNGRELVIDMGSVIVIS